MTNREELENYIKLTGKMIYIVYHNEETLYTVARFLISDEKEKTITVTGMVPSPETDTMYTIYGSYTEHPRYGMQFNFVSCERPLPEEADGIIKYLSGVSFPGIGKKTAEKIVALLGDNCLEMIRQEPSVLYTIPGLSADKITVITEGLREEDDGMEELIRFLNIHGIGMRNLVRLNRAYGKQALEKIKQNPYRVIEECDGFGFKTADKIAMALGFAEDDERRLYAFMISLCMDLCMRLGDSYVSAEYLRENFEKQCQGLTYDYDSILDQVLFSGRLVQEDNRIYPDTQYEAETGIAKFLEEYPYEILEACDRELLDRYLLDMQKALSITYDEDQVNAIHRFFDCPFMILTGGPGTGKTTVVRALVQLFRMLYPSSTIVCAAPTGRAAKRLSELTDTPSMTIHSLLKWDLETNTFGVTEEEPILADLLIIDEFSMVDSWLFYNLLKASKRIKRICVIGDEDQLPSVSLGSVLRDLIESERFPLVRLSRIYRQRDGSDVIELAHMIHDNRVDLSALNKDVRFIEQPETGVRNAVVKIVQNALDKGYTINDIQVLSPMYGGSAGIDVLNNALQEAFNPPSADRNEARYGYVTFREGDKILQLKNQPDDDVYNGDIGILEEIIPARESETHQNVLIVNFDGIYVEYSGDNVGNISLAYCISVHKSQGSEYPIVIFPIVQRHAIMLQRKLIYTGITRSRQSLILIGDKNAFMRGISQLERHIRQTTLKRRLTAHGNEIS